MLQTAPAVNVNVTANSHNRSRVHSPTYLLLHLLGDRVEPNVSLLHNDAVAGLFDFTSSVRTHVHAQSGKTGDVQDVGVGDISSWRSLAHLQHSLSLCKMSDKCVLFYRKDMTLYKISRHFFFFMFKCLTHFSTCSVLPSLVVHQSEESLVLVDFLFFVCVCVSSWSRQRSVDGLVPAGGGGAVGGSHGQTVEDGAAVGPPGRVEVRVLVEAGGVA